MAGDVDINEDSSSIGFWGNRFFVKQPTISASFLDAGWDINTVYFNIPLRFGFANQTC